MMNIPFDGRNMEQFIGTAPCDTIGLVIGSIDSELQRQMNIPEKYRAVGLIGSRTGAAAQITAVDDALKQTAAKLISIEIPRDTKGWGGHGNFIVIGSENVSDVRAAVKVAVELIDRNCGEIYISDAGHLEFQYSARCDEAISSFFGIPKGQAFGFVCASPAPIGLVIADIAVKSANVELVKTMRPSEGTSHSNEIIAVFTGESTAVKKSVIEAKAAGLRLLRTMGSEPEPVCEPFIS